MFFSGEFSTVGHWTMNVGEDNVIVLDDLSVVEPPLALKQNKQILKVQTVTVKHNILLNIIYQKNIIYHRFIVST